MIVDRPSRPHRSGNGVSRPKNEPDVVTCGIERHTLQAIAEGDAKEQSGNERPHEEADAPELLPLRVMRTKLEAHRTDDETEEHEHDGQVEAGKHGRVCGRERGEQGTTRSQKPDLVAIPDRTDGGHEGALFARSLCHEGREDARAQIEAIENVVCADEHGDDDEPEDGERHDASPSCASTVSAFWASARHFSGPLLTILEKMRAHAMKITR